MENIKIKIAEAALPAMSVFESLGEEPLRTVRYISVEGSLDRIKLDFGSRSVVIAADGRDDSIDFTVVQYGAANGEGTDESGSEPWSSLLGKSFFWAWATVDQRGYLDGLLISFAGMIPQVLLTVVASSIKVATVGQVIVK